jgi:lantibiotic modifying enzyme
VTLRNFFSSASFRLVAWCAAVFGVSVAVLLTLQEYYVTAGSSSS